MKKWLLYITFFALGTITATSFISFYIFKKSIHEKTYETNYQNTLRLALLQAYAEACDSHKFKMYRVQMEDYIQTYVEHMNRVNHLPFVDPSDFIEHHTHQINNQKSWLKNVDTKFALCKST